MRKLCVRMAALVLTLYALVLAAPACAQPYEEAVAKALGTGIGEVSWTEIEILGDEQKAPRLTLYGKAESKAKELGLTTWSVSISHNHSQSVAIAVAFVVAIG